jgi:hypothetical protein
VRRGCRAILLLVLLGLNARCRALLGPDDARPPVPDGDAGDVPGDDGDAADARDETTFRRACDLRLQDCPNKQGCYPDDQLLGDTHCLVKGSGGPLSQCAGQEDCDGRLLCLPNLADPAARVCVELCRPGVDPSGCQVGVSCISLPPYDIGYCGY